MRQIVVVMCVFFSVVLFSGCGSLPQTREGRDASSFSERPDELDASTLVSNSAMPKREPPIEAWRFDDLPLRAGVETIRDGGAPDTSSSAFEPVGHELGANVCHGRTLTLSSEVREYVRIGYQLWHLCYRTPSRSTSTHSLAGSRPESVIISVFHEPSRTLRETIPISRSTSANSWIANALLILSPQTRPFFFVENRYSSGQRLGAVTESAETGEILSHGTLQMWPVETDGRQEASVPGVGVVCAVTDPVHDPERHDLFFVPHLACLGGFESCRLGRYDCRDMLALPF